MVKNHKTIAEEFKGVLARVTEECDLLRQDHLARGSLIETANVTSWWYQPKGESGQWNHHYMELFEEYQSNHPDEYWGQHQPATDVVGGFVRYPWMPANISQKEDWDD